MRALDDPTPNPSRERGGECLLICRNCGRQLPEEQFELYPTGTRRRVCRQCHYEMHGRRAWRKWWMKQRARVVIGEW